MLGYAAGLQQARAEREREFSELKADIAATRAHLQQIERIDGLGDPIERGVTTSMH
jgi:hypothetical protein